MKHEGSSTLIKNVKHLKHSTIRIEGEGVVMYFDPFKIEGSPMDADIIFVTHIHYDHFSPEDIHKVMKKDTVLVITEDIRESTEKEEFTRLVTVGPGKEYEACGIRFRTVPAYNIGKKFHTKDKNWVGYIVTIHEADYYFAGDTDNIPEMKDIKADVAFLPVGGTYTMTAGEAADAANIIKPKVAVPIHYGDLVGSADDARTFLNGIDPAIEGVILK